MSEPSWMKGTPEKILLATDLSCRCDRAFDRAVMLAQHWKAQLLVLHVLDPRENALQTRQLLDLPTWRRPPDRVRLVEAQVRRDVLGEFGNIAVRVEEGDPADVIVDSARKENCGLIVTGVARDETLGRYFLGATVDRLVRRSSTPILIVKNRVRRPYSKIVVATDFSDSSVHALNAVVKLFPLSDLSLFHSFEVPFAGLMDKKDFRDGFQAMEREARDDFLNKSVASDEVKLNLRVLIEQGAPDVLLRAYVQDKNVDLVVLGTHGRGGVFEVLIGSTAKRILEAVPGDILLVREPRSVDFV